MSGADETITISRCGSCQAHFLPSDGPCPRCGSTDIRAVEVPALGQVLVATELAYPAAGWTAPHVLALIEIAEGVRVLAIVEGPTPARETVVSVRRDGPVYRARSEPAAPPGAERGEGESPRAGATDRSFEPPR